MHRSLCSVSSECGFYADFLGHECSFEDPRSGSDCHGRGGMVHEAGTRAIGLQEMARLANTSVLYLVPHTEW